jgi:hypothetical protein
MTGSTVGVVDGIGLAKNGFGIQADGLVKVLSAIGLVARFLKLGSVCLAVLF